MCVSVSVYHMDMGALGDRKKVLESQAVVSHLTWVLGVELGPLEEQQCLNY